MKNDFKISLESSLSKMKNSIRLELIFVFALCFVTSAALGKGAGVFLQNRNITARVDYSKGIDRMSVNGNLIGDEIKSKSISIDDKDKIQKIIDSCNDTSDLEKIMITDLNGKVLYKSNNADETQIDVYTTIKNSIKNSLEMMKNIQNIYGTSKGNEISKNREYISFYPINFSDGKAYLVIKGMPQYEIIYEKRYNPIPGTIVSFISFLTMFYFITNKKMKYIENISSGLIEISRGNLDYRIKSQGRDELALLSNNINFMAEELNNKMKVEREEERIKNELITNVSHDLRTPLTSIKGYLALIKDKRYEDETQMKQYINIAYNKSEKLEELINDLFEYTKLTNNAVNLNRQSISLNGLLEQLIEELVPICEETGVTITRNFPKHKFLVYLDPNKTARVFENLFINAIRYSIKPGDVEVSLKEQKGGAVISIKNKCEPVSKEEVDKLFDRFYRVDKSRSSNTGGSGLGLAIAKSIVEIQGGKIKAEYSSGYMIFDVIFNLANSRS
ncbi:HAMP domain-containing sensor histidine kinase [Clostridium sp. AWRP]|uniref:sensor histidine kinase n=1 Tax=Clostridium sp. AWRP TaxID=2212991 RepID=UPI000FD6D0E1|nr:HAMP domain-containing sensor histidine kinase [Clostridium sp. AWRP]AZV56179.1 HAMP domain-containing histidine kinase [Clostridium sp. AWRP]